MKGTATDIEERILLLTPTGRDSYLADSVLTRAGLITEVCSQLDMLCRDLRTGAGALLIAEEALAWRAVPSLASALLEQPPWSDIPIVILTTAGQSPRAGLKAMQVFKPAGNVTLLERPLHPATLVTAMQVALRSRRKQYEVRDLVESLQSSLKEKEVLLQEVHHRVKNNLQVVSSLLALQSRQITDTSALGAFHDSTGRVKAMALVHEKLYGSPNLGRINFAAYAAGLVAELFRSYNRNGAAIKRVIECDDWEVDINKAVPLGLILNELISNSLKYAFPDGSRGEIRIVLRCNPSEGTIRLTVSDDGIGFQNEQSLNSDSTLGLRLVKILSDQLEADMQVLHNNGTTFCFTLRSS